MPPAARARESRAATQASGHARRHGRKLPSVDCQQRSRAGEGRVFVGLKFRPQPLADLCSDSRLGCHAWAKPGGKGTESAYRATFADESLITATSGYSYTPRPDFRPN